MNRGERLELGPGLHQLLVDAARSAPDAPAVVDLDPEDAGPHVSRSYGKLLSCTERFADALWDAGVRPGDRVIVDADNSGATIAMLMACSMVGAAFVPLSTEVPDERARQIFGLSRPRAYAHTGNGRLLRLTDGEQPASVGFIWGRCSVRPSTAPDTAGPDTADLDDNRPHGDRIGYLIFTSGSTGTPKGVVMPQKSTCAFFAASRGLLRPGDRVASTAPLQFDFCLLDIGVCLANRSTIVPIPRAWLRWPRRLVDGLRATECTRVHAVPSVWRSLLRRQPHLLAGLPKLDTVMYSGEPFPAEELAILCRALPTTRVVNCYGPTECMACSFTDVTPFAAVAGPTDDARSWPEGLPIDGAYPGSRVDLIDDDGSLIDVPGRSGQIRFSGPSVFAGYWTATGTVVPPDSVQRLPDGTPSLLTGDYGHFGDDGRLRLDGRKDRQLKVLGNRVELGDIESVLRQVRNIDEACVVATGGAEAVMLTAFVSGPAADSRTQELTCRQQCIDQLPAYMRPARFIHLPELPRSANGKIDQRRLAHEAGSVRPHGTEKM